MSKFYETFATRVDKALDRLPQSEKAIKRRKRSMAIAGFAGSAVFGYAAYDSLTTALEDPSYSQDTHAYEVSDGDNLYNIARNENEIHNALEVDVRSTIHYIVEMEQNKDPLSDGLQEGDVLTLPNSVEIDE